MKKRLYTKLTGVIVSMIVLSNTIIAIPAQAITLGMPPANSFLWMNQSYNFLGGFSTGSLPPGEYYTHVTAEYVHRASLISNTITNTFLGSYPSNSSSHTYFSGYISFTDSSFPDDTFPYFTYDSVTGKYHQYGPYIKLKAYSNANHIDVDYVKCNLLLFPSLSDYQAIDPNVSYTYYGSSSFRDSATGKYYKDFNNMLFTYNCMAYAVDKIEDGWLWPFNDEEDDENYFPPTIANVNDYLTSGTYGNFGLSINQAPNHAGADVIAYGSPANNKIAHFAKVISWNHNNGIPEKILSKWGGLELIESPSPNVFSSGSGYGVPLVYYNN